MAKFTAMDIADFYIRLSLDLPESSLTNLMLNKLCYYAQGWSIAKLGYPLFDEEIEAWKYGPVIPSVYHTYKVCGDNSISQPYDEFDERRLDTDELNLLIDVFMTYGKYSPGELVSMTHRPGGPWMDVYEEMENNVIPKESLKRHFEHSSELETMKLNVKPENTTEYA